MTGTFTDSVLFIWVLLPILIALARIVDVTIGTIRIIAVARGQKLVAALLGFFEVLIWLVAIGQIIQNLTNPLYYFAYALGFACGNFVGMTIEEKIAMGTIMVRIITNRQAHDLLAYFKEHNFGFTNVEAEGRHGRVHVIFTIIKRRDLPDAIEIIKRFNPSAFFSVEDIRLVNEGIFPLRKSFLGAAFPGISGRRKGK
ncbi:DUF2179 domain-containing protein [bacterium]|nr:DUF2179 domain-containing protein [candidate division CSSED10-310 bacterium]